MKPRSQKPVLLVTTSTFPRWSGDPGPLFVHELSRRMVDCFDVYVLAPHAPGSRVREVMEGATIVRFRYAPLAWERLAYQGGILENLKKKRWLWLLVPMFIGCQLLSLVRLLRQLPVRIVHCHWIFPQGFIGIISRGLTGRRVPVICTSHGSDLYGIRGAFYDRLKGWILKRCRHVTVVSRAMQSHVLGLGVAPQNVSVISMGVDLLHRFVPPQKRGERLSLLFVGRLIEVKGLRFLLEAMPIILAAFPDATLTVVGQGPQLHEMQALAEELGIQERVHFVGAVANSNLPAFYQRAWVLVFPSVGREGFGLVPVEALGCECVPVVTDQGAIREIVHDRKTGIIVPTADSKRLADAVIELGCRPDVRSAMAQAGRRYVAAHFDWSVIAARYRRLLLGIASP